MPTEASAETTAPSPRLPVSPSDGDRPNRQIDDVLDTAARIGRGKKANLSTEETADALEWFLSDVDEPDETHSFEINVGTLQHKKWVTWAVRPVDPDRLKRIRRASQQGNRMARRMGSTEFDEVAANVSIVVEGTVVPDIRAAAKEKGLVAPEDWVRAKFAHKPGLLTQIAGEVMACSGYDEEDVREVDAAQG